MNQLGNTILTLVHSAVPMFFCYTALNKVVTFEKLRLTVLKTPHLPPRMASALGMVVIFSELAIPLIFLLLDPKSGLLWAIVVLVCYTLFFLVLKMNNLNLDCDCFGLVKQRSKASRITWWTVARNLPLVLLAFLLYADPSTRFPRMSETVVSMMVSFSLILIGINLINIRRNFNNLRI